MKTNSVKYSLLVCAFFGSFLSQVALAGDKDNAVLVGGLINPIGSVASVAYERMVVSGLSVGGRLSTISYNYWDGSYNEWGSGNGVEVNANYHFHGDSFSGPFIGVAIGQVNMKWNWYNSSSVIKSGYGTSNLISTLATFGWDFAIGSGNFVIRPSVVLGSYSGAGKDNTGTKTSGVGAFGGAGVSAAFAF